MPQMQKVGKACTKITKKDGVTRIKYHETEVVTFGKAMLKLDSGGWKTQTTKNRMNQASKEFSLGFSVVQRKGEWFVKYKECTRLFEDGMLLLR